MSEVLAIRRKGAGLVAAGPAVELPSMGASEDADQIRQSLDEIEKRYRSLAWSESRDAAKSLTERLYDALADAKVMTARVAMHLDQEWRDRLFTQLDDLLDVEDWHENDEPVLDTSFATFLRMILHQKPERRPGLGVSHRGHLIAAWTQGADRLTLEFLPADMIRWVLSCDVDGERELAAGDTPVGRLPEVLSPYTPARWFAGAEQAAA